MQFLNNDSEELMRKAAADYPVQPIGMNWDAVALRIQEGEDDPRKVSPEYLFLRYAAMILFFLLLSLVCNKYLRMDFNNRYAASDDATIAIPSTEKQGPLSKTTSNKANTRNKQSSPFYTNPNAIHSFTSDGEVQEKGMVNISRFEQPMIQVLELAGDKSTEPVFSVPSLLPEQPTIALAKEPFVAGEKEIATATSKATKNERSAKGKLFASLMVGPDVSNVKMQKTEGVGINAGLLLSYKLSSKWQVESGVLLNRKEYYSTGKYFNASKTYLPPHSVITDVEGYCTMFEVPVNVRYTISQKKNSWYATTGLSSYFMTKEAYDYTYTRYDIPYEGYKTYTNASKNWLSVINASISYEHAVTNKMNIRLEPYLKIPIRGMGSGRLPISSTGMNVGVSYPIK